MSDLLSIDDLLKAGLLKKGNDPSLNLGRIPFGIPQIDALLGGGLPLGKMILNYGPESTGKTLISQYTSVAIQKTSRPIVLYIDLEGTYDEEWWKQSGVDTSQVIVSSPATGEQATDVIRAMLYASTDMGLVIVDSLAGMVPQPEADPEKSSSDKLIGAQARTITQMYRQIKGILGPVIFMANNQMRETIGQYDELHSLPGGRAQRHYSHIILRTRRESWINDSTGKNRLGFYMEVINKKNKTAAVADGDSIKVPFLFNGAIDMLTSYIEDGVKRGIIAHNGPYYKFAGQSLLGMVKLREFFNEHPDEIEELKGLLI